MNAVTQMLAPSATDMIRADHTRVLAAFHKYDIEARPATKRALVETVCFALEVHAQIEEEIFYPALRGTDSPLIDRFVPEHAEMRRLIASLRGTNPEDASDTQYDAIFMELMRSVMHHVADEETLLLPEAERVLGDEVCELGAHMMKRRLELKAPAIRDMTRKAAVPAALLLATGALVAGGLYAHRQGWTKRFI